MSSKKLGQQIEIWVGKELENQSYQILTTNFRSPVGEIDIIAVDEDCLVLVEVKARRSTNFGQPYEAVNFKKLQKIARTGDYFRNQAKDLLPSPTRIDVASVLVDRDGQVKEFQLLKNVTR